MLLYPVKEGGAMPYRILVVEDEPDAREVLTFMLRLDDHNVNSVDNGRDALEALAGHSYDVILTDFRMPEMTGEDLYRRIERGWPHLAPRVVFVTADPAPGFQTQYGGAPVPVLTKPYTPERLRQVMASVIARDV
jgi:two-component system NtrC family sensor kinase